MSAKEAELVSLLVATGEAYGIDLVKRSDGKVGRGTVYVTLDRMEEKGFVESREEPATDPKIGIPRRMYRVTGLGQRVLAAREVFLTQLKEALP